MFYQISEGNKYEITKHNDFVNIVVPSFGILLNNVDDIIKNFVSNDKITRYIKLPEEVVKKMVDIIIKDEEPSELTDTLVDNKVPLFSLVMGATSSHKRNYSILKKFVNSEGIYLKCDRNNIINGINFAKKINRRVIIDSANISLKDYKELFNNYNFDELDKYDIKINYQEANSPISPREVYEISLIIDKVVKDIKNSNLSKIEQVMYTYDMVKRRIYKDNKSNIRDSRDLNKVLKDDYIVCVGYSNLFNAILKCLGINVMPLVSSEKRHQRSIAYIKDEKYNIDGVFAFDPTWDSRKKTNEEYYIDRYNYFLMSPSISNYSAPSKLFEIINLPLDKLIEIVENDDEIEKMISFLNNLETLSNLVDISSKELTEELPFYKFHNEKHKKDLLLKYNEIISKYKPKELDISDFLKILYNVRREEYYNDIISDMDIDDIKWIVVSKYLQDKKTSLLINNNNSFDKTLFEMLKYDLEMTDKIEEVNPIEITPERDKENLKLTKILRKIKEKYDE